MPSIAAKDVVHVAVGLLTDRGRVFVTRRPPNAHQGGKWEFPGGKVQIDESVFAALQRELHEELGIEVRVAHPLMQVQHVYPDKRVHLDAWSVTAYTGTPHGREGQQARWASRDELFTLDFPAADRPIQRRLWLPALYAISDAGRYGQAEFLDRLERALASGLRLLQLREPQMSESEYCLLAQPVVMLCHRYGAKVILNADPSLVRDCDADGVHLSSLRLRQCDRRPLPEDYFVAASCHNEAELTHAANIQADMVVLGPVAATASHPGAVPLGWEAFETLCRGATLPVYALGGMRTKDISHAQTHDAQGLAMISGLWEAPDIRAAVMACEQRDL